MVNWSVIGSIILPNVGGWVNGIYFFGQVRKPAENAWYLSLNIPRWAPQKWVFGPVWTILYSSMGFSSYLVYQECGGFTEKALLPLTLYGAQLALNWGWMSIFFAMKDFKLAFIEIAALDVAAVATTVSFMNYNKTAAALMLPYLAWLCYASSITYHVWKYNPKDKKSGGSRKCVGTKKNY